MSDANLGDGTNGLSEAEKVDVADAISGFQLGSGYYSSALTTVDGLDILDYGLGELVERIVREHTERALAEVERRIEARRSQPDHFGRASRVPFGAGLTEAINIIRAARQERDPK